MEAWDYISIVLNILATIGGSSVIAALLPLKFRKYAPIIAKILDLVAANVGSAKNKEPEKIEQEKREKTSGYRKPGPIGKR